MNTLFQNKTILTTLLFSIACLFSGWLAYYSLGSLGVNYSSKPDTPDTFMTNIRYIDYDPHGSWESTFSSPQIVHYPKKNTAFLDDPQLISKGENHLIWFITAKHGVTEQDGQVVYLKDQVRIKRVDNATQKNLLLTTTALTAYPKRKYIETDQPLTILQPGSTTRSVGLTADLNTGNIELLAKTDTVYQKPEDGGRKIDVTH